MSKSTPLFSIIIPYRSEIEYLKLSVRHLNELFVCSPEFEVIFVQSGSDYDFSTSVLKEIVKDFPHKIIKIIDDHGPGIARNAGLTAVENDWVFYLDVDDYLTIESLKEVSKKIASRDDLDIINFNWKFADAHQNYSKLKPKDWKYLESKCSLIHHFVQGRVEGSVIFSAFKTQFLRDSELYFAPGLHEDILFIFQAYLKAKKIESINKVLYIKNKNLNSVTSQISKTHIQGYFNSFFVIFDLIQKFKCPECLDDHAEDVVIGTAVAFASRVREITRLTKDNPELAEQLGSYLANQLDIDPKFRTININSLGSSSVFGKILRIFLSGHKENYSERFELIKQLEGKSWSCKDLHQSVFFAPNEIRTCCKRFFVDGQMKGDVALEVEFEPGELIDPTSIRESKRDLWWKLNSAQHSACDGCPFMEFKDWEPLEDNLKLSLISMEQHSICNLRCTYCDETYFGGKSPNYDIEKTISELATSGDLSDCKLIVWGGGEPFLDPNFNIMIEKLRIAAPYGQHRVLSNSIRYSSIVAGMLESNTAQLVTSIDAGDGQTYKLIRGRDYFDKVMSNLVEYSKTNSKRITIKYIFTPDNCELNQIDKFCEEVKGRGLLDSYFQVSVDFKQEWLTEELLQASIYLYLNLRKIGVYHVYMDEHIWQRWTQSHRGTFESLPISHLNGDLLSYVCNPNSQDPFYIYGAGQLTSMLLSKSNFLDRWEVLGILDDTPSLAGKKCFGFEIEHSDSLKDKDGLIFLSGIQGIVYMKETVLQLGLNRHAILENLIW